MSCGCRKNTPNRRDRIKQSNLKQTQKIESSTDRLLSTSSLSTKASICMSCIESKQNEKERKKGIRVCRKSNRLVNNIIRDPRFVCPLGKWRNSN